MKEFLLILFSVILIDNLVLSRFLGVCSFLGLTKSVKNAMGMSVAVIFVMLVATAASWADSRTRWPAKRAWRSNRSCNASYWRSCSMRVVTASASESPRTTSGRIQTRRIRRRMRVPLTTCQTGYHNGVGPIRTHR